ncbi:MAG: hypothetical protein HQM08_11720 [Candidatus Riflebacteria bacterium]|nr:hypothetical protein [Candidatus Riflebacteria bacterium]
MENAEIEVDKVLTEKVSLPSGERNVWHRPIVTRLEMTKTMFGSGSVTDGGVGFTPI